MHAIAFPSLWHERGRPGNALDNAGLPRCTHPDNNSASRLLREPPTSTVAPPRFFPTKQRSDHSAWSSSSPDFRGTQNEIVEVASPQRTSHTSSSAIEKNDLLIAYVQDVPIEARPPFHDIAKTDEFTRHGRSWALCDSSQLRPSSSLEPQLITFDRRANKSQEA